MQEQLDNDILKAVGVRYVANPELGCKGAVETDEMCRRTVARLEWLDRVRPRVVLMADHQNKDPHAVMVRCLGEKVAYLDKSKAPEIRGMLKAAPRGMLTTAITGVVVGPHGYFLVKKPEVSQAYTSEEIGVDWSNYQVSEPVLIPNEYFDSHDELSLVIMTELVPRLAEVSVEELRLYFGPWLNSIRYNQSREVQQEMQELISLLAADKRKEVRQIAVDIDHLRTKKGSGEVIEEMVELWWNGMLSDSMVNESFSLVCQRCLNERRQLLSLLGKVEEMMRNMPGELYDHVGSPFEFFSRLGYLAPTMTALSGVLSLFAIRTLLCRELDLSEEPFFGTRTEMITDVREMPATIGRVMDFADSQCKEYAEILTVQRLADYLRQDYLNTRNDQIESIISRAKPATNIFVDRNYGPCNGNIQEQRLQLMSDNNDNNTKLIEQR